MVSSDFSRLTKDYASEQGNLIPLLQQTQRSYGYLPEGAVQHIARFLKISENRIFGVASFYSQFRFNPPGRHSIKICLGTACHVKGGQNLLLALQRELDIVSGQTTEDGRFDLERVACLGCCALAPVVKINDDIFSEMTVVRLKEVLDQYE